MRRRVLSAQVCSRRDDRVLEDAPIWPHADWRTCDAAMGIAFASTLGWANPFTTVELKRNFLRPVRQALASRRRDAWSSEAARWLCGM